jgi:hypothetical protein
VWTPLTTATPNLIEVYQAFRTSDIRSRGRTAFPTGPKCAGWDRILSPKRCVNSVLNMERRASPKAEVCQTRLVRFLYWQTPTYSSLAGVLISCIMSVIQRNIRCILPFQWPTEILHTWNLYARKTYWRLRRYQPSYKTFFTSVKQLIRIQTRASVWPCATKCTACRHVAAAPEDVTKQWQEHGVWSDVTVCLFLWTFGTHCGLLAPTQNMQQTCLLADVSLSIAISICKSLRDLGCTCRSLNERVAQLKNCPF